MQFAHPRLLITSSLPLRFSSGSSVSPFFAGSSVSPFFAGSSVSPPVLRSSPVPPFPAGFPVFRFSVLRRFLRFSAGSPPFPRYRRLGAPPEGAVGAVTEGETAEAWEERDAGDVVEGDAGARAEGDAGACVELYRILGFSGYSCGANPSNGRIFSRAVPHFAQNMVQLDRGCTDMICFIYICRRLHSISKEMWGKNVM